MLVAWVSDNNMKTWSEGLRFIQSKNNRALFSGIKTSPYEAVFGTAQRIGLGDSLLTEDMHSFIETEEELEQLFNAGINNGRDKEEAKQQDRKDEDENETNDTSEETVEKKDNKNFFRVICEKESSGARKCSSCDQFVHAIWGSYSEESEGFELKVTCNFLCKKESILSDKVQNMFRNKPKKWFLSSTQDFQQLMLGQTLWSGCLTLIEDV